MNKLVTIRNDTPRASTGIIAEGLGIKHKNLLELIEKHKIDLFDFGKIEEGKENLIVGLKQKIRNKKTKVYFLNKGQSYFVGTLAKNTKKSIVFKKALVMAFEKLEKTLTNLRFQKLEGEYQQIRIEGKNTRKNFTDTIIELQNYALNQNPNANIKFMFSNYTKVINNNLFDMEGKFKNIREVCNKDQLTQLKVVEDSLIKTINEEMENSVPYKDIYYIIKKRLNQFQDLLGKSKIITLEKIETTKTQKMLNN